MHTLLPLIIPLASIATAVGVVVIKLQPYRLARHFGDLAAKSTGKQAERAQELALKYARQVKRASPPAEPSSVDDEQDD